MPSLPKEREDLIRRYIEVGLQRGYSREQVKKKFMSHGYGSELFDEIYSKYFGTAKPAIKPESIRAPKPQKKRGLWIALGILLVIIIGILAFWFWPSMTKSCRTAECFAQRANQCVSTTYMQEIEGSVFLLESEGCKLHKRVVSMGKEPNEVKQLLADKELTCSYVRGEFKPEWANTLTLGLEDCEGPLKEALSELLASTMIQ